MLPVFANSALMFGYPNPSWTAEWEGWVYCDTVSAGNAELRRVVDTLGLGDAALTPGVPGNYDMGRLLAEGWARADPHATAWSRVSSGQKMLPAASERAGTTMGFGQWERSALKGTYLVLRPGEVAARSRSTSTPTESAAGAAGSRSQWLVR